MNDREKKDPFDGEYVGNVFGWRLSMIGLIVLLFFLGVMVYRHYKIGVGPGWQDPDAVEMPVDSSSNTDQ